MILSVLLLILALMLFELLMLLELFTYYFRYSRTALFVLMMISWPGVQCTKNLLQKKDLDIQLFDIESLWGTSFL